MSKTSQKIKDKLKEVLGVDNYNKVMAVFADHKFTEVAAKDGSMLAYEGELKEGTAVFIVTAEGNKPVEGPIELEDGTILETKDGLVTKITPPAAKMADVTPEIVDLIKAEVDKVRSEMQAQIDELKAAMEGYTKPSEDINTKVDAAIEDLNKLLAAKDENKERFAANEIKFSEVLSMMEQILNLPIAPGKEEKFEAKSKRETNLQNLAAKIKSLKINK